MHKLLLLSILGLAACGGGGSGGGNGGISDSRTTASLSAEEQETLCEEFAEDWPVHDIECDGETASIGWEQECGVDETFNEGCTATVGDARACIEALAAIDDAEWCTLDDEAFPAACAPLEDC